MIALFQKMASRPEIINLLESIKYSARLIQFTILNLRDRFNQTNQFEETKTEPIEVREVVMDTVNFNKVLAQSRKQKLSIRFETRVPQHLNADPSQLQQTLNNLLRNSIKIMPEYTSIGISIDFAEDKICIAVDDHGTIAEDEEANSQFLPINQLSLAKSDEDITV